MDLTSCAVSVTDPWARTWNRTPAERGAGVAEPLVRAVFSHPVPRPSFRPSSRPSLAPGHPTSNLQVSLSCCPSPQTGLSSPSSQHAVLPAGSHRPRGPTGRFLPEPPEARGRTKKSAYLSGGSGPRWHAAPGARREHKGSSLAQLACFLPGQKQRLLCVTKVFHCLHAVGVWPLSCGGEWGFPG